MRCPECGENINTLEMCELCNSCVEVELHSNKQQLVEIGEPTLENVREEVEFTCPNCHRLLFEDEGDAILFLSGEADKRTTKGWIKYMRDMMTQDSSEINATRLAIEKWELVRDGADITVGMSTCALCYKHKGRCDDCPISDYTGKTGCNGTPIDGYDDDEDETDVEDISKEMVLFLKRILKRVIVEDRLANE